MFIVHDTLVPKRFGKFYADNYGKDYYPKIEQVSKHVVCTAHRRH